MKSFPIFLLGSLLFTFVSCGNRDKSSHHLKQNSCDEISCLSTIKWKILLQGRSFPDKSRVVINDTTVLNECLSKQKYQIDRESEPQKLEMENFFVPKRGEVKIDVFDLGQDCTSESNFISHDNVEFEVTKDSEVSEIVIHL